MNTLSTHSDRVLRPKLAAAKLGCSRQTLYTWIAAGILPRPIRLGLKATGWRESDLDKWLSKRADVA